MLVLVSLDKLQFIVVIITDLLRIILLFEGQFFDEYVVAFIFEGIDNSLSWELKLNPSCELAGNSKKISEFVFLESQGK